MTAPREMDDFRQALYLIADEMRGMATLAKQFGNVYEAERAHRIMEIAAKVAALADDRPTAEIQAFFEAEPWLRISPAVGVDAFVVNADAEILLVQRRDNSRWCMPGGVAEIGQTFAEAVLRELWEEAGLRGEVKRLLGVFDGRIWGSPDKVHLMNMVFQVECRDLGPKPGLETLDARFFPRDRLPAPLHYGHDVRVAKCFEVLAQETFFDPAASYDAEMPMYQRPDIHVGGR